MKHWVWYLAFFLLLLAGDRLGGLYMHYQTMSSQFRYSRLYRRDAWADILLLGNSRGLTFYQPHIEKITGKTTCNLSYNGLPMDAAQCLTLDFLDLWNPDGTGEPQRLLIDITMCDRENDALLAGFMPYSYMRSNNLDNLIQRKLPVAWWGGEVSWLYRYNNEIFQRAMYYQNKSDEDWLLDREIPASLAKEVSKHSYDLEIHPYLIQKLQETVAEAQRRSHCKVELLISPYFPGFQVKNLDLLRSEVEKATGLVVRDYRAALSDPADFGDFMHPNKKGSVKYLDLLKQDGVLP